MNGRPDLTDEDSLAALEISLRAGGRAISRGLTYGEARWLLTDDGRLRQLLREILNRTDISDVHEIASAALDGRRPQVEWPNNAEAIARGVIDPPTPDLAESAESDELPVVE